MSPGGSQPLALCSCNMFLKRVHSGEYLPSRRIANNMSTQLVHVTALYTGTVRNYSLWFSLMTIIERLQLLGWLRSWCSSNLIFILILMILGMFIIIIKIIVIIVRSIMIIINTHDDHHDDDDDHHHHHDHGKSPTTQLRVYPSSCDKRCCENVAASRSQHALYLLDGLFQILNRTQPKVQSLLVQRLPHPTRQQ